MDPLSEELTFEAKYAPAMKITDQTEADAYFEACVQHTLGFNRFLLQGRTREEAEAIERRNIGYYAGYYSNETRERVERLFRCEHPFFGSIAKNGPPTAEQAFKMGQDLARRRQSD
jgi:hypothetical protein